MTNINGLGCNEKSKTEKYIAITCKNDWTIRIFVSNHLADIFKKLLKLTVSSICMYVHT